MKHSGYPEYRKRAEELTLLSSRRRAYLPEPEQHHRDPTRQRRRANSNALPTRGTVEEHLQEQSTLARTISDELMLSKTMQDFACPRKVLDG